MILFHGYYRLCPRRLAFRNDYCRSCEGETVAFKVRTFDILYVDFIPVLPVGFGTRWVCSCCDETSHARTRMSRLAKWLGALFFLVMTAGAWLDQGGVDDGLRIPVSRVVAPLGALLFALSALRTPLPPKLHGKLEAVHPSTATTCPACQVPLIDGEELSCPECGMARATGDVAVQAAYESVRQRQVLAYAVLFALLVWAGLSPFSAEMFFGFLLVAAFLVFNNRCPSCEHAPGGGLHPRACSACGIQLR